MSQQQLQQKKAKYNKKIITLWTNIASSVNITDLGEIDKVIDAFLPKKTPQTRTLQERLKSLGKQYLLTEGLDQEYDGLKSLYENYSYFTLLYKQLKDNSRSLNPLVLKSHKWTEIMKSIDPTFVPTTQPFIKTTASKIPQVVQLATPSATTPGATVQTIPTQGVRALIHQFEAMNKASAKKSEETSKAAIIQEAEAGETKSTYKTDLEKELENLRTQGKVKLNTQSIGNLLAPQSTPKIAAPIKLKPASNIGAPQQPAASQIASAPQDDLDDTKKHTTHRTNLERLQDELEKHPHVLKHTISNDHEHGKKVTEMQSIATDVSTDYKPLKDATEFASNGDNTWDAPTQMQDQTFTGPIFMSRFKDGVPIPDTYDILYYKDGKLKLDQSLIAPDGVPAGSVASVDAQTREAYVQTHTELAAKKLTRDVAVVQQTDQTASHIPPPPPLPYTPPRANTKGPNTQLRANIKGPSRT